MLHRLRAPDALRVDLAHALGYPDYPSSPTADPYLNYILNRHFGHGKLEDYLGLFLLVVRHFTQSHNKATYNTRQTTVQELLDHLVNQGFQGLFADTKAESCTRREDVEDTVMFILGTWLMMLSSFVQLPNGMRKILTAYKFHIGRKAISSEPYDEPLAELLNGSCLLPTPGQKDGAIYNGSDDDVIRTAMKLIALLSSQNESSLESPLSCSVFQNMKSQTSVSRLSSAFVDAGSSLESLYIKATRLNAFKLKTLGAVDIAWTQDLSKHMLLARCGGRYTLEIFALPCVFQATAMTYKAVGIHSELLQEIQESYSILFNAWPDTPCHAKYGFLFGIRRFCWCWSCSAYRFRIKVISNYKEVCGMKSRKRKSAASAFQSEFDPLLIKLMESNGSSDWTHDLFPSLWSRITLLEHHLSTSRPWSIWILFRDRRDTLQFWTFLFATVVVLLTLLQVILGIAQVIGSFT